MNYLKQEQGFTMIEALLSLLCAALFTMILAQTASFIIPFTKSNYEAEDALAVRQLQLMLAQAKDIAIDQNRLVFTYHQESFYLVQYKDQLVKRKGFEVILQDIKQVRFFNSGQCYAMEYQRDDTVKRVVLACEE